MDIATPGMQQDIYRNKDSHTKHMVYNTYDIKYKVSLIKYLHQAAFSPPKQTLLKAINDKQFSTWPEFTYQAVKNISQTWHQK